MLLGNGARYSCSNPMRVMGGATSGLSANRASWHQLGARLNAYAGEGSINPTSGVPAGYRHPAAFLPSRTSGGLSSFLEVTGDGNVATAGLAGGRSADASLAGAGDITVANLALVVSAVAALAGSGDLSAGIIGKLEAAADLAGSGDLVGALGSLAEMVATIIGSGGAEGTLTGRASMSADIVVTGDVLNTANVAAAVWDAVAGAYNTPGSMGEKLNDAGSASNPWTEVIESGYTAAEILRLLASVAAGKTTVDDLGGGYATVTFRDLSDTKDRVVADMVNSERSDVTKDLT